MGEIDITLDIDEEIVKKALTDKIIKAIDNLDFNELLENRVDQLLDNAFDEPEVYAEVAKAIKTPLVKKVKEMMNDATNKNKA